MAYNPSYANAIFCRMPNLTEKEEKWCRGLFLHYIFYKNVSHSKRSAVCSCCGHKFFAHKTIRGESLGDSELWLAYNGTKGRCSHCGMDITYRPAGIYRTMETLKSYHNVVFFQTDPLSEQKKGLYQRVFGRCFICWIEYHSDREASLVFQEKASYIFEPGRWFNRWRSLSAYDSYCGYRSNYLAVDGDKWCGEAGQFYCRKRAGEPWQGCYYNFPFYTVMNFEVLDHSFLKFSQVERYGMRKIHRRRFMRYLCLCCEYPSLEIAARTNSWSLVDDFVDDEVRDVRVNWKARDPLSFFGISKNEWNLLKNCGMDLFKLLEGIGAHYVDLKTLADFIEYVKRYDLHSGKRILDASDITGRSFARTVRYLYTNGLGYSEYCDYVNMAHRLGYDLKEDLVCFPRDLAKAHNLALDNYNLLEQEVLFKRGSKKDKTRSKLYTFTDGTFFVRLPETLQEIVEEGNKLHHCVGSYAARHFNFETTILFFRSCKKPDTSLYTIEMNNRNLVQVQGKNHCAVKTFAEKKFLNAFLTFVFRDEGLKKPMNIDRYLRKEQVV